jgi:hypothetical protein
MGLHTVSTCVPYTLTFSVFLAVRNTFDKDASNAGYNCVYELVFHNFSCHSPRFPDQGPFVIGAVSLRMMTGRLLNSLFFYAPTTRRLTTLNAYDKVFFSKRLTVRVFLCWRLIKCTHTLASHSNIAFVNSSTYNMSEAFELLGC